MSRSRRATDPVELALPDAASVFAAALASTFPPLPDYEPAVEITVTDFAARNHYGKSQAERLLKDKGWVARDVRLPRGNRARAFRPPARQG
jgi:hypothetical protein